MVRNLAMLVGAAFVGVLAWALLWTIQGQISDPALPTAVDEFHLAPKELELESNGPFGKFDKRQLQRGLQVYKEVCSACHSLSLVAFRDLKQLGYNDAQVKKFAADWATKQPTFDEKSGDRAERPNVPSDHFPTVYYAGNGTPPDLSLITKARHEGPAYVHSLLTGYAEEPAALVTKFPDAKTPEGLFYNPYFANLNIAMPPPLTSEGQVQYLDGTKPTVDQMAKDVAAFLVWTAEPNLESRHAVGWPVVIFLLIFCFLAWGAYQNVWRDKKH
ncbi:MAG: cytochrome [Sphingomonas bacterium]|uniref:cytochrome c1 n=1 Tax=Sphingomonas bacterium TaxID=1895847 RepID=UPI00262887CE|nr:cytochrome c1 [Sphingomonas bacterium]MDB5707142.1 cytochrome [Sphingomonas bacterium]